jgi:hypothetical protein
METTVWLELLLAVAGCCPEASIPVGWRMRGVSTTTTRATTTTLTITTTATTATTTITITSCLFAPA